MTDESTVKPVGNGNLKPFKKGYDPRRWLNGRGKKSPEQREGEEILRAVYWKELSRVFDAATGKPVEPDGELTALELAVRSQIKKQFDKVAERIAGKVTEKVDVNNNGQTKVIVEYVNQNSITNASQSTDADKDGTEEA